MFEDSLNRTEEMRVADEQAAAFNDDIIGKVPPVNKVQSDISAYLPDFTLLSPDAEEQLKEKLQDQANDILKYLLPEQEENFFLLPGGENFRINEPELEAPMSDATKRVLLKDADVFPPEKNPDGSTTYTIQQIGITDRAGMENSINYFKRNVNITVPEGNASLNDCDYRFGSRENISKEQYDQLIQKAKTANPEMTLFTHGVSTTDVGADRQALLLELSSGRPTINLDWAARPSEGNNPFKGLLSYAKDTIAAKRANDNDEFESAIDSTINQIGADHTGMVGFSHGGMFDTRYLKHRAENKLPNLDKVILTHPDVPVGCSELRIDGRPEVLKQAAEQTYVIGGKLDLALKAGAVASKLLPGTPTFQLGGSEERLGNDDSDTRKLINAEGALPISERDRSGLGTQHFLNYAGINELLSDNNSLIAGDKQSAYNNATDMGRIDMQILAQLVDIDTSTEEKYLAAQNNVVDLASREELRNFLLSLPELELTA